MSSLSGKNRVQEILIFVLTFHFLMTKEIVSLFAPKEWLLEGPISPDQCYGGVLINQIQLLYPATAGSYTGYYSMDATSKNGPLQAAADSKLPPVSLNRHAHFGGFVKAFARRLTKQSGACVDNLPPRWGQNFLSLKPERALLGCPANGVLSAHRPDRKLRPSNLCGHPTLSRQNQPADLPNLDTIPAMVFASYGFVLVQVQVLINN